MENGQVWMTQQREKYVFISFTSRFPMQNAQRKTNHTQGTMAALNVDKEAEQRVRVRPDFELF